MSGAEPKDSRNFFVLPQKPEGAAYYTYGTPINGAGQYAEPRLLSLLLLIEHRWQAVDNRKIGIGNISLANGGHSRLTKATGQDGTSISASSGRTEGKHRSLASRQSTIVTPRQS